MPDIQDIRMQIDELDHKIIDILGKRLRLIKEVNVYKKANGLPALDKKRWQTMLVQRYSWANAAGLEKILIKEIFEAIHQWSLRYQKKNNYAKK